MKIAQSQAFRQQRQAYALRFTCEHCVYMQQSHGSQVACAHGYPTWEHVIPYYENADAPLVFCKDFELG